MRLPAKTLEEYFAMSGDREPDLRQLDEVIRAETGLEPKLFGGMSMNMLGYGMYHYKYASGREGDWPPVSLAPQKNYISLYIMAVEDGQYLAEKYESELGKVSCGKSCIRFKKFADLNLAGIRKVLKKAKNPAKYQI